jgi:hypothetical protein
MTAHQESLSSRGPWAHDLLIVPRPLRQAGTAKLLSMYVGGDFVLLLRSHLAGSHEFLTRRMAIPQGPPIFPQAGRPFLPTTDRSPVRTEPTYPPSPPMPPGLPLPPPPNLALPPPPPGPTVSVSYLGRPPTFILP